MYQMVHVGANVATVQYERTFSVAASADVVWSVRSDVERWHTWTDSIRSIEIVSSAGGHPHATSLEVGSQAIVRQPGFPAAKWTVTEWRAGRTFTWESLAPGLRSVGIHAVESAGEGASTVTLSIGQTGPLAGVMGALFGRRSRRYVDLEANGLRSAAEGLDATASD